MNVYDLVDKINITDMLSHSELDAIGKRVADDYEEDENSRNDWIIRNNAAM